MYFPSLTVNITEFLPREVKEYLLAALAVLLHDIRQVVCLQMLSNMEAELRVAVAVGEVLTILFPKQIHRHAGLAQFLCDILQTPGKILEAFLAVRCITARIAVLKHRILQLQQAVQSDVILVHELDILADSLLVHAEHTSDLAV